MPQQTGVLVTDTVRTPSTLDEFGVVDSKDIIGGCHNVNSIQDRDNIPLARRYEGMLCTVGSSIYQWIGGSWIPFSTGGGGQKVSHDIGNGSTNVFEIVHNLGTRDIIVTIRENISPYRIVYPGIEISTVKSVEIKFSKPPDLNKYRVVILA
jgi:hypothetical protein